MDKILPFATSLSAIFAKYCENDLMLGSNHSTVVVLPNPGILAQIYQE